MSMKDINLAQMLKSYLDGLELHFVSKLLPIRSWFKLSIVLHIHLHAILDRIFSSYKQREVGKIKNEVVVSKRKLIAILDDIKSLVKKLNWSPIGTEWANYYKCNNYADSSFKSKKIIIEIFLREIKPTVVWDIGANTGYFSEVASSLGSLVISMDLDVAAVEMNYLKQKSEGNKLILPILMNITNPSPNLGWALQERYSLINRGPADCILALALIHHLALTHNIPLYKISNFFSLCSKYLIIEFIPKNDSKVVELLKNKIDSYYDYTQSDFVKYFSADFVIMEIHAIIGSNRTLFLMKSKRCQ
jgi:2-polyprenyl-3-methyl-5-hydroxy-6-metoxy-1,4-benzoquinol methylase